MHCLIGVTTCHTPKYAPKVQAQRETWVRDADALIDVRFFYGGLPSNRPIDEHGDEIFLTASDDSYLGRPSKIRGMCRWALAAGYDWTLKTDDDVYIDIPTLMRVNPVHPDLDYVGRGVTTKDFAKSADYCRSFASGFAYWLSRKAMQVIADTPDFAGLEDRWVAEQLNAAGIKLTWDNERYVACYPGIEPPGVWRLPATRNGAAFCEFGPAKMREMHACNTARRVR